MGDWLRPIDVPLSYFLNPILVFVIIYSVMKVTDLRNHYYPGRLCLWGDALKIYLKSNIILLAVCTATLSGVVIFHLANHLWVERGYMPRADQKAFYDEGGIGYIRLVVTRDIPINLYANFFCGEKGETINYFKTLVRTSEAISCLLQIRFDTMDEKQIDFDLSDHDFILRDHERPEIVYRNIEAFEKRKSIGIAIDDTCSCTIETPSYKEPYTRCSCELKYVFETPPKEVELVFPGIYIADEEYQLSPYIFVYHEYLKHGTPNWRGEID
jgi:hypothetical protein